MKKNNINEFFLPNYFISIITDAAAAPTISLIDDITNYNNLCSAKYESPNFKPDKNVGNIITIP